MFKSKARASEHLSRGEARYFAYPFHVVDDTMPVHVHKTLCSFYTITKIAPATQGRNEGWQGWRHKVPTMSQILLSIQYICFRKILGSKIGRQNPLLLRQQSQKSRFVSAAMLLFHSCFFSHSTIQNYEAYHY